MRRMKKRILFSLRRKYDELSILPPLFMLARPNGEPGGAGTDEDDEDDDGGGGNVRFDIGPLLYRSCVSAYMYLF